MGIRCCVYHWFSSPKISYTQERMGASCLLAPSPCGPVVFLLINTVLMFDESDSIIELTNGPALNIDI